MPPVWSASGTTARSTLATIPTGAGSMSSPGSRADGRRTSTGISTSTANVTKSDGRYMTDVFTDEAVEFIGRHMRAPFFLLLAYSAPHYPFQALEEDLSPFRDAGKFTSGRQPHLRHDPLHGPRRRARARCARTARHRRRTRWCCSRATTGRSSAEREARSSMYSAETVATAVGLGAPGEQAGDGGDLDLRVGDLGEALEIAVGKRGVGPPDQRLPLDGHSTR